ncbi:MAG: nucleotidyltransferase substrate binding protein [Gammaproteobacteria bacterium]|nr:nucleotidyltransferase substrate binding protein [Gammaproteobacteria bacterium]
MILNLASLKKTISCLNEAIEFSHSDMAKQNEKIFEQFRNSVIQCFEFTYELSWKMLKRRLELDSPTPAAIDELSFNDMIREAAVRGYINEPVQWIKYRKERNITSHAYDEKLAQEIYKTAIHFLKDAQQLFLNLDRKNG